jgi:hypothetical protein
MAHVLYFQYENQIFISLTVIIKMNDFGLFTLFLNAQYCGFQLLAHIFSDLNASDQLRRQPTALLAQVSDLYASDQLH